MPTAISQVLWPLKLSHRLVEIKWDHIRLQYHGITRPQPENQLKMAKNFINKFNRFSTFTFILKHCAAFNFDSFAVEEVCFNFVALQFYNAIVAVSTPTSNCDELYATKRAESIQ